MDIVPFAIAGGGWRAEFYLRVAGALPDRFRVTSVLTRDPSRAARVTACWGVPVRPTLDDLLADHPAFVVASVAQRATPALIRELAACGMPVLVETPPAPDLDGLAALRDLAASDARIQVAEQYRFQPHHAARLAVIAAGELGTVTQAQVSVAHDYHGMDLLRAYLGVGLDPVTITAHRFVSPIIAGPDRTGPPAEERIEQSAQVLAWLDFDGRLGVYDFAPDQYFSWIRGPRVLVRGERGEIEGMEVRALRDVTTPVAYELVRRDAGRDGNLEGLHLAGITAGDRWVYRNPFAPARLADDEIAVATCLARMGAYVGGGEGPCSLAEAMRDQELALRTAESWSAGRPVRVGAGGGPA